MWTVIKNLSKINKKNYQSLKKLKNEIDKFKPEIVISDFEPYSVHYGRKKKIKIIGFDNEHYISEGKYNLPGKYKVQQLISRFIISFYKTEKLIIFTLPGQQLKKNSSAKRVMPVIKEELIKSKAKIGKHILVYNSIINDSEKHKIFSQFNERFIVFGPYKNKVQGNIALREFNEKEFNKALISAKAVITFGGINVISEAIYLKKPLLVIPIKNQFEQALNALYIKENKYGEFYEELTEKGLKHFLNNLDNYRVKSYKPGNKELFNLIDKELK